MRHSPPDGACDAGSVADQPTWSIEDDVTEGREQAILGILREHNWRVNGSFMAFVSANAPDTVRLSCVAADGTVIGGLLGSTQRSWLRVDTLAVVEAHRRSGVGSTLLARAEAIAVERGCRYSFLESMDYQGTSFYPTCGYEAVGVLEDWDSSGHAKVFFTKRLG